MLGDDLAEIHPVELVAAQNEHVIERMIQKMNHVLAHGVGGALIPRGVRRRLFGGEDFHEAAAEVVELVGLRDVPVQRGGVELRQQIDAAQAGVDAVGDRDVHEAVFAGERHRRLGAFLREREQPLALSAAHDDGEDVAGVGRLSRGGHKNSVLANDYASYNLLFNRENAKRPE